jgi:L-amino acid N-acyltransferase YncA
MSDSLFSHRLADLDDLPIINHIYNLSVPTQASVADLNCWDMERRISWFEQHDDTNYPVYVFMKNQQIIGWFSFSAYRPGKRALATTAEISYFLHPEETGKTYGQKMMTALLIVASQLQKKHLIAILLSRNVASIKLLKRFGFKEWGRMPSILDFATPCDHLYYGRSL